jgi:hypothetical protein
MKQSLFSPTLRKTMFVALIAMMAMGACKSKKKAVEPAPAPAPKEEVVKQTPPTPPPARTAQEIAAERLENYFSSVSNASNLNSANQSIQDALSMFSNQEIPVLIVIHEEKGVKDYDEPTTIKRYLEYLKDTKKNLNYITDVRLDGSGKVSELELKRK